MQPRILRRLLSVAFAVSALLVAACYPGDDGASRCGCTDLYAPTCASDGETYMNTCLVACAAAEHSRECGRASNSYGCRTSTADIQVSHDGRCPGGPRK